jgi:phosphoserine phosphatase
VRWPASGWATVVVSGSNAFRVGVVAARLQVALRGEGVAFEVDPEPTVDAAGEWRGHPEDRRRD